MSLQKQSILFINGLDKTVNENMLYQLFNDYSVSYIKIAKDHNTRESFGYAFIGFKNNAKAEEAIKKLNYSKLAKKTLRISWYNREPGNFRSKIENNIFVKKIPKEVTAKEFDEYFRKFGNIVSAKLAEDEEKMETYFAPRITEVVERYLGKGKKVSDMTRDQVEQLSLIVDDMEALS